MAGKPEIFRTPGYPLFLAGVFKIWGDSLVTIVFIQIFLSCIGIFLVYKLALRLCDDHGRALMTAVIYSLDPWTFQISFSVGADTLFTVLVLGFALLTLRFVLDPPSPARWYIFSAIALAACVFTRPLIYYFIIPLGLLLVFDKRSWKGLILGIAIYVYWWVPGPHVIMTGQVQLFLRQPHRIYIGITQARSFPWLTIQTRMKKIPR